MTSLANHSVEQPPPYSSIDMLVPPAHSTESLGPEAEEPTGDVYAEVNRDEKRKKDAHNSDNPVGIESSPHPPPLPTRPPAEPSAPPSKDGSLGNAMSSINSNENLNVEAMAENTYDTIYPTSKTDTGRTQNEYESLDGVEPKGSPVSSARSVLPSMSDTPGRLSSTETDELLRGDAGVYTFLP